tara:strand:- start:461 stop:982 length:522 start_codon:yes stop_codon:yes gene_type:complete
MKIELRFGDGSWLNIPPGKLREWESKFPGVKVVEEIHAANDWLERNKSKRWKTLRGMEAWLERASRRYGNDSIKRQTTPAEQSTHPALYAQRRRDATLVDEAGERNEDIAHAAFANLRGILSQKTGDSHRQAANLQPTQCEEHEWFRGPATGHIICRNCGTFHDSFIYEERDT